MTINSPSPSIERNDAPETEAFTGFLGSPELDETTLQVKTKSSSEFEDQLSQDSSENEVTPDKNLSPAIEVTTAVPAKTSNRALCIGINAYMDSPLRGCVNDAKQWSRWFQSNGFLTEPVLTDASATREGILDAIRRLVSGCRPGDVIAIQYAGHGTQLPDINGDEAFGDTPGLDEALVPVDYRQQGFILDDDIGDICNNIPAGANVTFFMDCCHSGTNTRSMFNSRPTDMPADALPRFLLADDEMISVHLQNQSDRPNARSISHRSKESQTEISFAACLSHQLAWESNGQGNFTRNALTVLQQHGIGDLSHEQFLKKVRDAFPANARQDPLLSCSDQNRQQTLLVTRQQAPQMREFA